MEGESFNLAPAVKTMVQATILIESITILLMYRSY